LRFLSSFYKRNDSLIHIWCYFDKITILKDNSNVGASQ